MRFVFSHFRRLTLTSWFTTIRSSWIGRHLPWGAPSFPLWLMDKNGITALMAASLAGHRQVVESLLANGAEVNAKTEDGQTALIYASIKGYREIVEMILAKGAEVDAKDKSGKTALMFATRTNHPEVRELLIEAGAK